MRAELRTLLASFEAVTPLRGETAAHATIRKMSIEQAEALAGRIVTLFGQVARLSSPRPVEDSDYGAAEASSGGAEVLPLFAAEA